MAASLDVRQLGLLGFDVFGTVVDWRTSVARAAAPVLARHGVQVDPFAFADAWRALYQPAMEAVRSGARPWVKLDVLTAKTWTWRCWRTGSSRAGCRRPSWMR